MVRVWYRNFRRYDGGFSAIVALFDSTITFHAQYQQRRDLPALLDLLVLDRDNPRSLSWVIQTLQGRLAQLAINTSRHDTNLAADLPNDLPALMSSAQDLASVFEQCQASAFALSDNISRRYFSHASGANHSLGT